MRDWEAFVRDRLALPPLTAGRADRIVREIATQLEDFCRDARSRGASEQEADDLTANQIADWDQLARSISAAERTHVLPRTERWQTRLEDHGATRDSALIRLPAEALRELRYAARQLAAQPAFTLLAILTLALGIGANTAIFSVVHAVLLRALPYQDPDRLVAVWADDRQAGEGRSWFSYPAVQDLRAHAGAFEALSGLSPRWAFTLRHGGEPQRVFGYYVSAELARTLGLSFAAGRGFTAAEDSPGGPAAVIITHGMWVRRFGADPSVVGKPIDLDGAPITVVGVLPAGFHLLDREGLAEDAELWLPLAANPIAARGRGVRVFRMIGRLRPDATTDQARVEMVAIADRLATQYPETDDGLGITLLPLREDIVGAARPLLVALAAAVGLVLLIACANVAGLMLVRATSRQRQIAIRAALGAGRWRLAAGPLAEGALLASAGAVAGLALAAWTHNTLVAAAPSALPRRGDIAIDGTVLLFALAAAALTTLLFALAPALHSARPDVAGTIKDGGASTAGRPRQRLRRALVVAEVALALVVVSGAALLVHSLVRLQRVQPGFTVRNVAAFDLSSIGADAARRHAVMEDIYARLAALPGVVGAGETSRLPLANVAGNPTSALTIERRPVPPAEEPTLDFRRASRGYFQAMGIPLIAGRTFNERDTADPSAVRVAVINQAAASRFFPGEDPIGQRIRLGGSDWLTVVGIVGDIRHVGLDSPPRPEAYVHTLQGPLTNPQLVVRTAGDPQALIPSVRAIIRAVEPGIVISRVSTLEAVREASLAAPRFNATLFMLFAALALVLGVVGIYGVMSYSVTQRTHEMGVRLALGAGRGAVLRLVLREGLILAAVGTVIGLAVSLAAVRYLRALLFDLSPYDPVTLAGAAAILLATSFVACWIPARRATRTDPLTALRAE